MRDEHDTQTIVEIEKCSRALHAACAGYRWLSRDSHRVLSAIRSAPMPACHTFRTSYDRTGGDWYCEHEFGYGELACPQCGRSLTINDLGDLSYTVRQTLLPLLGITTNTTVSDAVLKIGKLQLSDVLMTCRAIRYVGPKTATALVEQILKALKPYGLRKHRGWSQSPSRILAKKAAATLRQCVRMHQRRAKEAIRKLDALEAAESC
jgi:hypothetical protein